MNNKYYNSSNGKQTDDEYYTTPESVKRILDTRNDWFKHVIYCPCDSEESEFVKGLFGIKCCPIYTSDDYHNHIDLFQVADIVITNPPFKKFAEWLRTTITNCNEAYFICSALSLQTVYHHLQPEQVQIIGVHKDPFNRPDGTTKGIIVAYVHYNKAGFTVNAL